MFFICIIIILCITQLITFGALFYLKHEMYWTNEWHKITTDLVHELLLEIHPELNSKNEESYTEPANDVLLAQKLLRHGEDPCQHCQIQSGKIDGGAFHTACNTCGKTHKNFIFDSDTEKEDDQ